MTPIPTRTRSRVPIGLALFASVALATGVAHTSQARQGSIGQRISCAMAAKDSFTADELRLMKEAANAGVAKLRNSDPVISVRGRDELVEPVNCSEVTVAFRAEYGKAIESGIAGLVSGSDLRLAANALLIMGRVKSVASIAILRAGIADERPAIRLAAAAAYKDFLSPPSPGLPDRNIDAVLTSLGEALARETDPMVADILVAALDAARFSETVRTQANNRMVTALSGRVKAIRASDSSGAWAPAILRAVVASRDTLIQQVGAGNLNSEFARNTGAMAGMALAYLGDRVMKEQVPDGSPLHNTLDQIAAALEAAIVVAHRPAGGTETVRAVDMRGAYNRAVETGALRDLQSRMDRWIGPEGLLTKAPYNIPAADLAPTK